MWPLFSLERWGAFRRDLGLAPLPLCVVDPTRPDVCNTPVTPLPPPPPLLYGKGLL